MIRIALVEDDPAYAEQLLSYLKEYEKESKERISVQTFSDWGRYCNRVSGRLRYYPYGCDDACYERTGSFQADTFPFPS